MTTLTEFLLDRIEEDEAVAKRALDRVARSWGGWEEFADFGVSAESSAHVLRHPPERIVAECEAKRGIVEAHVWVDYGDGTTTDCEDCWQRPPCNTLRLLSLPYGGHPEYQEAWKP